MSLTDIAVGAFLLGAAARAVVGLVRKDPLGESVTQIAAAGLAAVPLAVGLLVAPYRYVLKAFPGTEFYDGWLSDPLFLTFAGVAYAVLGGAIFIRVLQSRKF